MAYMSAVFWLLLLLTGLVLAIQSSFTPPEYFAEPSLFPTWPVFDSARAITLFILSMQIVWLPKALAWLGAMLNFRRCFSYGGPVVLTLSVLAEVLLSALFAPVMMVAQSQMVREILTGSDSGWKPQRRSDGSLAFGMALRTHRWHTAMGALAAGLTWYLHHDLFLWLLPVTVGLLLSAPLSWLSGKRSVGSCFRFFGILSTPEDRHQPPVLAAVADPAVASQHKELESPFVTLLRDDTLRAWHASQVSAMPVDATLAKTGNFDAELILARAKAERTTSATTLEGWLSQGETLALLHSPELVAEVARRISE